MTDSANFNFKNGTITITTKRVQENHMYLYTSKYHYVTVNGRRTEMMGHALAAEFYEDIKTQLALLENVNLNEQEFFKAFVEACAKHVERFKRIIITDMHSYLDVCMHIMSATQPKFHSLIPTEEKGIALRDKFASSGIHVLQDYLFVPHPYLKESNGMSKIIPYKESR